MAQGDPRKSAFLKDVGEMFGIAKTIVDSAGRPIVPVWALPVALVLIVVLYFFLSKIDLVALLKAWHEATKDAPAADPEKWIGAAPAIPVPEGGIPVPEKEWREGEP